MKEKFQPDFRGSWKRRILSMPLYVLVSLILFTTLPLTLCLAGVRDIIQRTRWSSSRVVLFLAWYFFCELWGIGISALLWSIKLVTPGLGEERYIQWHFKLQNLWTMALYRGSQRLFGYTVDIQHPELGQHGPYLLFVRHASVVDTLLASAELSVPYGILLRYVMKEELLWDPSLDLVGHRLPNVFVKRGSKDTEHELERVRSLVRTMPPDQGILIYPEGTRFTEKKRSKLLKRFQEKDDQESFDYASTLTHVLPPRLGGAIALMQEAPHADVVFFVHTGFEHIHTLWDLWNGKLIGQQVQAELWRVPASDIPKTPEEQKKWLLNEWKKVDQWVASK